MLIGQRNFATGLTFGGTEVGGLSGITYDAATNSYLSISDDRSQINPARFYSLTVAPAAGGSLDVNFTGVTTLLRPDGTAFPAFSLDPEGIALNPDGSVFVSSEGDTNRGFAPFVNRFERPSGTQVAALPVPTRYIPDGVPPAPITRGVRNNLAFESLTRFNNTLFTATENALFQDGPAATVTTGSASRILRYDLATGQPSGEFRYNVEQVLDAPIPAGSFATNGLVELIALDDNHLLALERSFSTGVGNAIRLYQIDLTNATNITNIDSLAGDPAGVTAVNKSLLLDLNTLGFTLDNLEGMTLGPVLPDGTRMLVIVSDNNFAASQFTQVLAFSVNVVPTPGSVALLGLGMLVAGRRKR